MIDLRNINWEWRSMDFLKRFPDLAINHNRIETKSKIDNIEFKAELFFSKFRKKIVRIEIVIPIDVLEKASPGSEIKDYIQTFNILKNIFGNPVTLDGANISDLESNLVSINKLNLRELPKIVWHINNSKVIHTFRDYWGIIPYTYIIEYKKYYQTPHRS